MTFLCLGEKLNPRISIFYVSVRVNPKLRVRVSLNPNPKLMVNPNPKLRVRVRPKVRVNNADPGVELFPKHLGF